MTTTAELVPLLKRLRLGRMRDSRSLELHLQSAGFEQISRLDDFGLQGLGAQQSADLYELIIAQHQQSNFIITNNRTINK